MSTRLDLTRIEVFRILVLQGSFTRAAEVLKQPKSRVSRQIAALERDLGLQLIYRTTRQFQLTEAGRKLFEDVESPLESLRVSLEQTQASSEKIHGKIRITAPEDIGIELVGGIAQRFMERHPEVLIELLLENRPVDLIKESIDLGIRVGRLRDSSMTRKLIGQVQHSLVASPALVKRLGSPRRPEDLESWPFYSFRINDPGKARLTLNKGNEKVPLQIKYKLAVNNHMVLRKLLLQGQGIAMLPSFLVNDEIQRGELIPVLKSWSLEQVPIQFIFPNQKGGPAAKIRRFIEFSLEELRSQF